MFCLELPNLRKSTRMNRAIVPVCEWNLSCKLRYMLRYAEVMIRKNPPNKQTNKQTNKQRNPATCPFRAIFFESHLCKLKMLSCLWQPHCRSLLYILLILGWLHHEKGLNLWHFVGQGGLWMKLLNARAILHFDHLWSFVRRFFENKVNQIERETNKSKSKASSGGPSTMFMCMYYIITIYGGTLLYKSPFFSRKDFYILESSKKDHHFWGGRDFSYRFMEQQKHQKKNNEKLGDPIVN